MIEPVGADNIPCVPPGVFTVKKILEFDVTAVVEIVIEPAVMAAETPIEAFEPVAINNLFPAVPRDKFPVTVVVAAVKAIPPLPAVTVTAELEAL